MIGSVGWLSWSSRMTCSPSLLGIRMSVITSDGCGLGREACAFVAVRGLDHRIPGALERLPHHVPGLTVVVDHEDGLHAGAPGAYGPTRGRRPWLHLPNRPGECELEWRRTGSAGLLRTRLRRGSRRRTELDHRQADDGDGTSGRRDRPRRRRSCAVATFSPRMLTVSTSAGSSIDDRLDAGRRDGLHARRARCRRQSGRRGPSRAGTRCGPRTATGACCRA